MPNVQPSNLPARVGSTVNSGGTRLSQAKPLGSAAAIDLTDSNRDYDTVIPYGNQWITIRNAINTGILERAGTVLTERVGVNGAAW